MQLYEGYSALGLARDGTVAFDLTLASGERRTVRLEAVAIDRNPNARWASPDWSGIGGTTLWLANPARPFSTHWVETSRVLYVQLNQVADAEDQGMAQSG
jgi:hypothetical protein